MATKAYQEGYIDLGGERERTRRQSISVPLFDKMELGDMVNFSTDAGKELIVTAQ